MGGLGYGEREGAFVAAVRSSDVRSQITSATGPDICPWWASPLTYLADALAIGPTLSLIDGLSPGMTISTPTGQPGAFCVIMPCRCVAEAGPEQAAQATVPAIAACPTKLSRQSRGGLAGGQRMGSGIFLAPT